MSTAGSPGKDIEGWEKKMTVWPLPGKEMDAGCKEQVAC